MFTLGRFPLKLWSFLALFFIFSATGQVVAQTTVNLGRAAVGEAPVEVFDGTAEETENEAEEGNAGGRSMWESGVEPDPIPESSETPDQTEEEVEAMISVAKARAVLDSSSLNGQTADFEQLKPYIFIGGAQPDTVEDIERAMGRKLVSLGSYPDLERGKEERGVIWGDRVSSQTSNDYSSSADAFGVEGGSGLRAEDPWDSVIEDSDFCVYLPFFSFNPNIPVSVDTQSTRKIFYKTGQAVRIVDLISDHGQETRQEFSVDLAAEEDGTIRALLLALRGVQGFPSMDEQFINTLGGDDNWIKAKTLRLLWRQEDGEVRTIEILAEVEGSGSRDLRGSSYSSDVQWVVDLLGKTKATGP